MTRIVASKHGPWWSNTTWGQRTARVNISIVVAILVFVVWNTLFQ